MALSMYAGLAMTCQFEIKALYQDLDICGHGCPNHLARIARRHYLLDKNCSWYDWPRQMHRHAWFDELQCGVEHEPDMRTSMSEDHLKRQRSKSRFHTAVE